MKINNNELFFLEEIKILMHFIMESNGTGNIWGVYKQLRYNWILALKRLNSDNLTAIAKLNS